MPKISVVMPVYNVEMKWLSIAIESILKQTFKDFELIIVDDGSTNGSYEICKSYQIKDSRINLFRFEKNQGIVAALNFGILHAKSDIIARQDGDDISLSDRLQKQYNYMITHSEIVLLGTQIDLIFENNFSPDDVIKAKEFFHWYNSRLGSKLQRDFVKKCCIANGSAMFLKEKFLLAGMYRDGYEPLEDMDLWVRLFALGKVEKIPECLYLYRRHNQSNSSIKSYKGLSAKIQIEYFNKIFNLTDRIALWGLGEGGRDFIDVYNRMRETLGFRICDIVDSSSEKIGKAFSGYAIKSPDYVQLNNINKIIVATSIQEAQKDIRYILKNRGYSQGDIYEVC